MILMRERIAVWSRRGGDSTSSRIPSIRYRTRSAFSYGSKWMSLAPRSIARAMRKLTNRMMGASDATPISCSTRSSPVPTGASSPTCSTRRSIEEPASPYPFSIASRISSSVPATTSMRFPVALATASLASASRGSAIATVSAPSLTDTGTRSFARRKEIGRDSAGAEVSASGSRRNAGMPHRSSYARRTPSGVRCPRETSPRAKDAPSDRASSSNCCRSAGGTGNVSRSRSLNDLRLRVVTPIALSYPKKDVGKGGKEVFSLRVRKSTRARRFHPPAASRAERDG